MKPTTKPNKRLAVLLIMVMISMIYVHAQSIGGYNVYYGHMHNHSYVSDGTGSPATAYDYAKNSGGLDFFSLSDHDGAISSAEWTEIKDAANSYNEDGVFTTFWGFEWSHSTLGHVTIINTSDYCTTSSQPTFENLLTWVSSRDCAAFLNHPGRQDNGSEFGHFTDSPSDKFVGMELWNKSVTFGTYYYNDGYYTGDGELGYFEEAIERGWKIGAGGSEDNHTGDWGTRTDNRMAILANSLTRADLYQAMHARRFFTTLDKNLRMSFKINSSEMGSTISGNVGQAIEILVSDGDAEVIKTVELYKNGILSNTWNPGVVDVSISDFISTSDGENYYIKVTQNDNDEAISSPIFIEGGISNDPPDCNIASPVVGTHYNSPQLILLAASANDPDGNVSSVEFFVDGISEGTDNTAPFELNWNIPSIGSYAIHARATDDLGAFKDSEPVFITVGSFTGNLSAQISSGLDDVEENQNGSMYTNSTDIELVNDGTRGNQVIGLRFNDLGIPQGASITSAYIQFTVDEANTVATSLTIKGHDSDNSEAFSNNNFDVSSRATTTENVGWVPPAWTIAGEAGSDQQTPDLSGIIQEIVDRNGFNQGSSVSIIFTGTGERTAEAFEGVPGSAATINIEYSVGESNMPPEFLSDPVVETQATEDSPYLEESLSDNADDPDSEDNLSFTKIDGPNWLSVALNGDLTGTPGNSNVGLNTWTVEVEDGKGGSDQAQLQITVLNTNDSPVFTADPIVKQDATENQEYSSTIDGSAEDIDAGDDLSYSIVSGPAWLSMNSNGDLSGTPASGDIGINSWTVEVSDDNEGSDQATLRIEVLGFTLNYCTSSGDTGYEFISGVNLDGNENTSISDDLGYHDYTNTTLATLEAGQSYPIILTPGWNGRSKFEYWGVWIDFNRDGVFDTGERVFTGGKSKSPVSGSITIPAGVSVETRMRVSMARSSVVSPCNSVGLGEVEDYKVIIGSPGPQRFYLDTDGDGYGDPDNFMEGLQPDPGFVALDGDCNDENADINPGATEICDGVDNNCDGNVDEGVKNTYYKDLDEDGYGTSVSIEACSPPANYVLMSGDCDDTDPGINPGVEEICDDNIDNNCDGNVDEGCNGDVYCEPSFITSADFISSFSINEGNNLTNGIGDGYEMNTTVIDLQPGTSYDFAFAPNVAKNRNFWRVWIDVDGSETFDSDEEILARNIQKGGFTQSVNIPVAEVDQTRMRISLRVNKEPSPCDDSFRGEVEDFLVNLGAGKSGQLFNEDKFSEKSFTIYPNPTADFLFIDFKKWEGKKTIRLIELTGKSLLERDVFRNIIELDISSYPKGIYFLEVNDGELRKYRKISKQ